MHSPILEPPNRRWQLISLLMLAFLLAGCPSDDDDTPPAELSPTQSPTPAVTPTLEPEDVGPYSFPIFLRGSFNSWETADELTYLGNNQYAVAVLLSAGTHEFKVADEGWSDSYTFSADANNAITITLETPYTLTPAPGYNNNTRLEIVEQSDYTFTVTADPANLQAPVLVVTQGSSLPPPDLPDDSQVEAFPAQSFTPLAMVDRPAPIPGLEALNGQLAIVVPKGEVAQFVYGDNLDGYYDGRTNAFSADSRYIMKSGYKFMYFASYADGLLNDRGQAEETQLYPYGAKTLYADGAVWDELVMHTHDRALTLAVHSDTPAILALIPKLNLRRAETSFERSGDAMVYFPSDPASISSTTPSYLAIATDTASTYRGADLEAHPELTSLASISETDVKPYFESTSKITDMRLCLAFGFTKEEAVEKALAMAKRDTIARQKQDTYDLLTQSWFWTADDPDYSRALTWARFSASTLVVEELGKGIWAGLPWFKDNWGRDTFISLPGTLLVTGQFAEARDVIRNFAAQQNVTPEDEYYGRIPNRVTSASSRIYNTVDGTPWMVREIMDYLRYTGDLDFINMVVGEGSPDTIYMVVKRYLEGALAHWVDDEHGHALLTHKQADTWMDAKFNPDGSPDYGYVDDDGMIPWSPRGDRAVEVQALWYTALQVGAALAREKGESAQADAWLELAGKVQEELLETFWAGNLPIVEDRLPVMADRVYQEEGVDQPDYSVRPNQLMLISVPFDQGMVEGEIEAHIVRNTLNELVFPYGVASLSPKQDLFHPYHDGREEYNKDAAYHNGTIWGWSAGPAITALTRYGYADHAYALTQSLAEQVLAYGCRGSMSENLDAFPHEDGDITLSGTFSQAWSVAELVRNGYQDYAGFQPDLLSNTLGLRPAIPSLWKGFQAVFPFGQGAHLSLELARDGAVSEYTLSFTGHPSALTVKLTLELEGGSHKTLRFALEPDQVVTVSFNATGGSVALTPTLTVEETEQAGFRELIGPLEFVAAGDPMAYPAMQEQDYLFNLLSSGAYEIYGLAQYKADRGL